MNKTQTTAATLRARIKNPFSSDKIYGHMDRVQEWLETGISRPLTFELDLTNVCNNKCPNCFGFYPERGQDSLKLDEARDIIRQIKDFGGRGLTFTGGGEPLMNPHSMHAVTYACECGLDIGFITNGLALTEEKARIILSNCQWVRISIDAATPKIYKITHGMDEHAFYKTLDNVRMISALKQRMESLCTIGIGFLTSEKTKEDVYNFAALGKELGVDYAQYRPLLKRFGESDVNYGDVDILAEMKKAKDDFSINAYKVLCSEHKYECIQKGITGRDYKKCFGHNFATVISADKKMYVCCHMRGLDKYCIGDLSKHKLRDIWQSQQRKQAFENINFRDCPPLCRCDSFNSILWKIKTGDLLPQANGFPYEHPNFI